MLGSRGLVQGGQVKARRAEKSPRLDIKFQGVC